MQWSTRMTYSHEQHYSVREMGLWLPYVVLAAAFGPYVLPSHGIMLAQVALYPCAVWALISLSSGGGWRAVWRLGPVPPALAFMLIWTLPGTLARQTSGSLWPLLSQLDNFAQPLCAALVGLAAVARRPQAVASRCLTGCAVILLVLLGANACLALWSALMGELPEALLAPWQPRGMAWVEGGSNLMGLAASMRRYTGIFQQPAEAGLTYSLALLVALYALKQSTRGGLLSGGIPLLLVGGALTKSKSFYMGLVLAGVYMVLPPRSARMLAALGAGAIGILFLSSFLGLGDYDPISQMESRLDPTHGDTVRSLTAGRYGASNVTFDRLAQVGARSPWIGYGLASGNARFGALDSEPLAYFVAGGAPMVAAYVLVIASLALRGLQPHARGSAAGGLAVMLAAFILLGGLGMPVLNGNRIGQALGVVLPSVLVATSGPRRPPT